MNNIFDKLSDTTIFSFLDEILEHRRAGSICLINSETGSGKTLVVPLAIQEETGEKVHVLEPRRALACNAAETLSELGNTELGVEVGYLIGHNGGETNRISAATKLIFTTYGFALAVQLVMTAQHLVIDELHEHSLDMTIVKGLIKHRYKTGNPPKSLVLMSATMDVEAETNYWNDVAKVKVFSAGEGRRFKCQRVHHPFENPATSAISLIDEGRKGVLIFASGMAEIKSIMDDLFKMGSMHTDLVISSIHGQSEYDERRAALAPPPPGKRKILVGTNVIESGMNLSWVDSGVSTGLKKENHVRPLSGAVMLTEVALVKHNVDQQAGRTNRFCDSKFILCGQADYENMAYSSTPEIIRLPLTSLYMHCQAIDIDPDDLEFMPQPRHENMKEAAQKLKNLGFFDHELKFTEDGRFAQNLPVSLEAAAMLCHAKKLGILADVLVLAGVYEVSSLRKDHREPHGFDETSDILDSACAYVRAVDIQQRPNKHDRIQLMESHNIGHKRYVEASLIVKSLEHRFGITANFKPYQQINISRFDKIRQCLLAASVCNMGVMKRGLMHDVIVPAGLPEGFRLSNGTVIRPGYEKLPVSGKLRVISPKERGMPFTIWENISRFTWDDLKTFNEVRPNVFVRVDEDGETRWFVNKVLFHYMRDPNYIPPPPIYQNKIHDLVDTGASLGTIPKAAVAQRPEVIPPTPKDTVVPKSGNGSLGDLLEEALKRRQAASSRR